MGYGLPCAWMLMLSFTCILCKLSKKTCVACTSELGPVGLYIGIIRKLLASLRNQWQQKCIALPSTRNDPSIIHMLSNYYHLFCSNIPKLPMFLGLFWGNRRSMRMIALGWRLDACLLAVFSKEWQQSWSIWQQLALNTHAVDVPFRKIDVYIA